MSTSILGSVTMGYQPVWNAWRNRCATRLFVEPHMRHAVDAQHLLHSLHELWPTGQETQILAVRTPALLNDLLEQAPAQGLWLEIPDAALTDPLLAGRARKARQRGVHLLWSGQAGQSPGSHQALFERAMRSITPQEALLALRAALDRTRDGSSPAQHHWPSPIVAGDLYDGLASRALVEHALDHQGAWGVAGWPSEEILYGYRHKQIQPSRQLLVDLVHAIDADESLESLEQRLGDEPLLSYRFLRYANSAALALRAEIGSVRQGLMTLGYSHLRAWLMEQMPHASADANLLPIRASIVMRARIMERLADAGIEDDLRREVFLCGMFSQIDLLLGERLGSALHRLPLPGRVASAILGQTGPYAPWLEVASALESDNTAVIRHVCEAHDLEADTVNRALLKALAAPTVHHR